MKLIVGIGNPGKRYIKTRHNIGFQVLDCFAEKHGLSFLPAKSNFWFVESMLNTFPFFLVKPYTYVNNSGIIVKELLEEKNIDINDLLVIYDDTNLEMGKIRIRKAGSDGGHNGIRSIIYNLVSENFARIRIGVSKPEQSEDLSSYVLSEFSDDERLILKNQFSLINSLIEKFIEGGTDNMLNYFSVASQSNSADIS